MEIKPFKPPDSLSSLTSFCLFVCFLFLVNSSLIYFFYVSYFKKIDKMHTRYAS